MKMEICRVLIIEYIAFLLINCMYCDTDCSCNKNKEQIDWIQKDYEQLKLEVRQENFKIVARLRRIERTKGTVSSGPLTAEGSSKSRADLEQNKQKMDVNLTQTAEHLERMDKIEDKIIKIEEKIEVTNRNEASFINITAQMNVIENKITKLEEKVKVRNRNEASFINITAQMNEVEDKIIKIEEQLEVTNRYEASFIDIKAQMNVIENKIIKIEEKVEVRNRNEASFINITAQMNEIEDKIIKIEEKLEVTNRNEASFINITAQMNEMDSKLETVTSQVNDIRDSYKMAFDFRNIISKTIHAEKTGRKIFHTKIRNKIENIEHLFSDFKAETTTLVHNLSVPLSTKYETFTEEITRQVSEVKDQINTNITLELDDLTNDFSQMKLSILALNKITNEEKTARNKLNTDIRNQIENNKHLFSDFKADLTNDVSRMKSRISALNKITIEDKTDGAWGSWGGWSPCSVTCGGGIMWKTRTCTHPKPALQGNFCDGTPIQISVCNKQTCQDLKVAFTAWGSSGTGTTYTVIKFPYTHFNSGGAYSTSTGRFTCKIPGIYHFAVTLTKQRKDIDQIIASIRINDSDKLWLYSNPVDTHDVDSGSYSLSAAGTFHLNVNDYVDVRGWPSEFYNGFRSFFTGFLVIPDTL